MGGVLSRDGCLPGVAEHPAEVPPAPALQPVATIVEPASSGATVATAAAPRPDAALATMADARLATLPEPSTPRDAFRHVRPPELAQPTLGATVLADWTDFIRELLQPPRDASHLRRVFDWGRDLLLIGLFTRPDLVLLWLWRHWTGAAYSVSTEAAASAGRTAVAGANAVGTAAAAIAPTVPLNDVPAGGTVVLCIVSFLAGRAYRP